MYLICQGPIERVPYPKHIYLTLFILLDLNLATCCHKSLYYPRTMCCWGHSNAAVFPYVFGHYTVVRIFIKLGRHDKRTNPIDFENHRSKMVTRDKGGNRAANII